MSTQVKELETEAHTTEASETTTGGSPLASLGINPTLFAFQLINFAIVASIIWFLILKPLVQKLTERQKMIDESIENSKRINDNLQKSEQKYQERIDIAKVEAGKILEKATTDAEKLGADMKVKAKVEIDNLIEMAKKSIRSERDDMVLGVKSAAGDLVVAALEKILSEKITDKKDHQLVEEMLKKLK